MLLITTFFGMTVIFSDGITMIMAFRWLPTKFWHNRLILKNQNTFHCKNFLRRKLKFVWTIDLSDLLRIYNSYLFLHDNGSAGENFTGRRQRRLSRFGNPSNGTYNLEQLSWNIKGKCISGLVQRGLSMDKSFGSGLRPVWVLIGRRNTTLVLRQVTGKSREIAFCNGSLISCGRMSLDKVNKCPSRISVWRRCSRKIRHFAWVRDDSISRKYFILKRFLIV